MYPVIISYSNFGYVAFAKNMLLSLDRVIRHHQVHVYCLDEATFDALTTLTFRHITVTFELYNVPVSSSFETYGTQEYTSITHTKMDILKEALFRYSFIHFIDGDVVCLKEPTLDHYASYAMYDVVFQYDGTVVNRFCNWCCTGNTTFRNTPGTHYILQKIKEYQRRYPTKNDQECLYFFFQDVSLSDIRECKPARLYTYPMEEYTNGYAVYHENCSLQSTYFFHANHVIGYDAKVELLQHVNQWFLDSP